MNKVASSFTNQEAVRTITNLCEITLNECFDMLLDFKYSRGDASRIFTDFQPKLAECLYNLMQLYQQLQKEKKALISQKENYHIQDFAEIMKENASLSRVISTTIEIGKRIGDAFVWIFFRNNRSELDKHLQHEPTGLYVGGIGGLGELEFVKANRVIDGMYVIYHGITTMLRIGDFSLFDISQGIVGVGEIKTQEEGESLKASAIISLPQLSIDKDKKTEYALIFERKLDELKRNFPKLNQQLNEHYKLFAEECSHQIRMQSSPYHCESFRNLSIDDPIVMNDDNSLLLFAIPRKVENLFDALYTVEDDYILPDGWETKSLELLMPSSQYNHYKFEELVIHNTCYKMPTFWLALNDTLCRDLYFLKARIITLFNPAQLLQHFSDNGFDVVYLEKEGRFEISKEIEGERIYLDNFDNLCYLVTDCFVKTSDVYAFACDAFDAYKSGQHPSGAEMNIHIHLDNFELPVSS